MTLVVMTHIHILAILTIGSIGKEMKNMKILRTTMKDLLIELELLRA